jgi:hypothetical protein
MSIISAFNGIVIRMYYNEGVHQLPHFHVRIGSEKASVAFDGTILSGSLSGRAASRVRQWAALHQGELSSNWSRARSGEAFEKIDPLP